MSALSICCSKLLAKLLLMLKVTINHSHLCSHYCQFLYHCIDLLITKFVICVTLCALILIILPLSSVCDDIKGTQDQDLTCSFSDSLSSVCARRC